MVNPPLIQVEEEEPLPVWGKGGAQSLTLYELQLKILYSAVSSAVFAETVMLSRHKRADQLTHHLKCCRTSVLLYISVIVVHQNTKSV